MSRVPLNCERIRAQLALAPDQQPSAFERAARAAHLLGCSDCRRFGKDVEAFTALLRAAPLEPLSRPLVVSRARSAWRSLGVLSPAAVAAMALAFIGLSGQFAGPERGGSTLLESLGESSPRVYPTAGELEQELSAVNVASRRSLAFTTNLR